MHHADVSHNAIRAFFSSQETGALNIEGKAAYSMTEDQIGSSLSDVSGSALLLAAGTTVAGSINVGALNPNADNARAASSNTLTVASDGKVLIKALKAITDLLLWLS